MSIVLPMLAGLARARQIEKDYRPFLYLICAGFASDAAGIWLAYHRGSNLVLYNFFSLAEAVLILWQFKRWGIFKKRSWFYFVLITIIGIAWVADSLVFHDINADVNSYFIIISSFIIILSGIYLLTDRMFVTTDGLFKDSVFLINLAFIIYFLYSLVVEIFWIYGLGESTQFRIWVLGIFVYINLFTNCIFAFAILCMRTKPRYMVQW